MFEPPFCPYKACSHHVRPPAGPWWSHDGFHDTKCFGKVQRFRCDACGRSFSTQTFSLDYYAKRRIDYRRLERLGASSVSVRALGRDLGCSPDSVLNRFDRLARQAIACHARLRPRARRHEDVSIDGFVSFDRSQYFPNNITISVARDSRYVLSFTHATLRRSGSMREEQKKRRDLLYEGVAFERKALERSFTELLDGLARERSPGPGSPLVIATDEKLEYRRAFLRHRLFRGQDGGHRAVHLRMSSKLPRTFWNPIFPSNYLDREIRKDQAAHRRESTCFARSAANGLSRMASYVAWRNYAKPFLVKAPVAGRSSHGEEAGIPRAEIVRERERMFRRRAFLSLERLDVLEDREWRKLVPTPGIAGPAYLPKYAFT